MNNAHKPGQTNAEFQANLLDIHNQRLDRMNANDVDFVSVPLLYALLRLQSLLQMVLSCASPCIQNLTDAQNASITATQLNNQLAQTISNNTARFGAFAALSMHDPVTAAAELNRTVKELGFLGALVNDYQLAGPDDNREA